MQGEESEDNDVLVAKQCLSLAEAKYGDKSDQVINALINVASTLHEKCEYLDSLGYFIRARSILESREDLLHPLMADILVGIGEHYLLQDMPIEARPYYEKALSIRNALFIDENTDTAHIHTKTGEILCIQGELDEAREHLFRALQIYTSQAPDRNDEIGDVLHNIGLLLVSEEQYDRAIDYLKQAITHREKAFGSEADEVIESKRILKHACEKINVPYEMPEKEIKKALPVEEVVQVYSDTDTPKHDSQILRGLLESALAALDEQSIDIAQDILRVAHKITSNDHSAKEQISELLSKIEAKIV